MRKILKRIKYNRLLTCAEARGALSDLQYEFRKEWSTTDAIRRVLDIARDAIEGERCGDLAPRYTARLSHLTLGTRLTQRIGG